MNELLKPLAVLGVFGLLVSCGNNEPSEVKVAEVETAEEVADPAVALDTVDKQISYALAYQMAAHYSKDPILEFDQSIAVEAISDAFEGKESRVSEEEMRVAGAEMQQRQAKQQEIEAAKEASAGNEFLDANKAKEGVMVTESGLQYEVITKGDSEESPVATDKVTVHYHGTLPNGEVFDSSVDRGEPSSFPLNGVIKGWTEGLQLMSIGDKFRFYIPSTLGYGARATGSIPANSTLIFDVELLKINGK